MKQLIWFAAFAALVAGNSPSLHADLVGLWSLDSDATDSSGNDNDGEVVDSGEFSDDAPEALIGGQSFIMDGGGTSKCHMRTF
jgi:hypothetical protein